ncbi:MAG TPA: carboxyl transferase domain-containing protein, partial [Acidimicrobiales bacterium]|nr:carboxyl transferase domain-containing protein [Acidimicrobiales bacterium]
MLLHPLQAEWDADLRGGDPLSFPGYRPPEVESVLTGMAAVPTAGSAGTACRYALVQGRFEVLGGSMGAVHGERVVRAYRRATQERLPVVVVTASGGARLQEGMIGLVQMARTAAAARAHAEAGLLQVAVLRGPTTGGVFASYASLADVKAAETGATIGFAGPRVVELVTGRRLPAHSHTAESAFRAGLVDAVVPREEQPAWVEEALGLVPGRQAGCEEGGAGPYAAAGEGGGGQLGHPGAYGRVQRARHSGRLTGRDWARVLCSHWTPLHAGDPCIGAALATLDGRRLVVVAMDRHHPGPAGYRLARRAV